MMNANPFELLVAVLTSTVTKIAPLNAQPDWVRLGGSFGTECGDSGAKAVRLIDYSTRGCLFVRSNVLLSGHDLSSMTPRPGQLTTKGCAAPLNLNARLRRDVRRRQVFKTVPRATVLHP